MTLQMELGYELAELLQIEIFIKSQREVNMTKVQNMDVWICHDETSYHIQFNISQ
jgi:hypothetical protein